MIKKAFFLLIFFVEIQSTFYRYPVATLDENNIIVIEQVDPNNLEVLLYNKQEHYYTKLLNSWFFPSDVQMLPDQSGFSFIDRGQFRIKFFDKKRPHTIAFPIDLFSIHNTSWVQDNQCLFTAKMNNYFHTFLLDLSSQEPQIFCFADFGKKVHCIYPQKINQTLFVIVKDQENMHSIVKTDWRPELVAADLNSDALVLQLCIKPQKEPLCFLHMVSDFQGYAIQLEEQKNDGFCLYFTCCQISQISDNVWQKQPLLFFKIPITMIMGNSKERLFESLFPLLPVYTAKSIVFTTYDESIGFCVVKEFDIFSNREILLKSATQHLFACQWAYGLL